MFGGIIQIDDGGGAEATMTLPTGTAMTTAAPPDIADGDSFYWVVVNTEADAGGFATIAVGADFTINGNPSIEEMDVATNPSSATFIVRLVTGNTWTLTRVS
jgi:hypothetical protein